MGFWRTIGEALGLVEPPKPKVVKPRKTVKELLKEAKHCSGKKCNGKFKFNALPTGATFKYKGHLCTKKTPTSYVQENGVEVFLDLEDLMYLTLDLIDIMTYNDIPQTVDVVYSSEGSYVEPITGHVFSFEPVEVPTCPTESNHVAASYEAPASNSDSGSSWGGFSSGHSNGGSYDSGSSYDSGGYSDSGSSDCGGCDGGGGGD